MWEHIKTRIMNLFGEEYVQIVDLRMEGYTFKYIAQKLGLSCAKVNFMFEKVKNGIRQLTVEWFNGTFNELRSVKELADKVVLTCTECLSRNYTTEKNKKTNTQRLEIKKYCPKCGKHTLHKETK